MPVVNADGKVEVTLRNVLPITVPGSTQDIVFSIEPEVLLAEAILSQ